jgi:hypothetical protein
MHTRGFNATGLVCGNAKGAANLFLFNSVKLSRASNEKFRHYFANTDISVLNSFCSFFRRLRMVFYWFSNGVHKVNA